MTKYSKVSTEGSIPSDMKEGIIANKLGNELMHLGWLTDFV